MESSIRATHVKRSVTKIRPYQTIKRRMELEELMQSPGTTPTQPQPREDNHVWCETEDEASSWVGQSYTGILLLPDLSQIWVFSYLCLERLHHDSGGPRGSKSMVLAQAREIRRERRASGPCSSINSAHEPGTSESIVLKLNIGCYKTN
ncbi:hypothetical protein VNO77_27231 [Canavalia gladiata]|uniref:Uncharacterized protein n=1 Tax=Canavalia gladiata TaxID=3824 RepID=A0AAN9KTS1_CANGL